MNIKTRLLTIGYNPKIAEMVAKELEGVVLELAPLVRIWTTTGEEEDWEAEGYSVSGLMRDQGMTWPAGVLTIDWLLKDPGAAKESLRRGRR